MTRTPEKGREGPTGQSGAADGDGARPGDARDAEDCDVIVVGSGFGGAVAAARLAQAGFSVTVLERGRRWLPGQFPRSTDLKDGWLWYADRGLYEARWLSSMLAVQAAGWGGGSLVYANVFARPAAETQDEHWPVMLRREVLDPYYDLAATMLGVSPVQTDPRTGRVPDRTRVVEDLVDRTGVRPAMVRPQLAVRFGDPDTWQQNRHGVPQRGCAFLGECILGCNHAAKNSLDMNYLAIAERHGARAVTGSEVRRIAPDGSGWAVWSQEGQGEGRTMVRRRARKLVLAAGAVGTTELLLRSRDQDRTLPDLPPSLGHGFSGNGDQLALGTFRPGPEDLSTGPTITTTTVLDVWEGDDPVWYQVQDGAVPAVVADMLDQVLPLPRLRARWDRMRGNDPTRRAALLSMGHDAGAGRLGLDRRGKVRLQWDNRRQAHLYRSEQRVATLVSRIAGARIRPVLPWSYLRRPVTVHPLGGVPVGPSPATSVVGPDLQVHGHPGLYVMDGSAIPASTGANPSATILAGAEQSVERLVREMTGDETWRAPEWDRVRPVPVPEDEAYAFSARRRRRTAGDGICLDEEMLERGADGTRTGAMRIRLTIPGLDPFREDPEHPLQVDGRVDLDGIPGTHAVTGTLRMFPRHGRYLMRYDLHLTDGEGDEWTGIALKTPQGRGPLARYRSLTHAELTLRTANGAPEGEARAGTAPTEIRTRLHLPMGNVLRNGLSIRGSGVTRGRRLRAIGSFAAFFLPGVLGLHDRKDR
jgi:cholesterol oxidase